MTDTAPELKPCPFCGNSVSLEKTYIDGDETGLRVIVCASGTCKGSGLAVSFLKKDTDTATAAWNTRTQQTYTYIGKDGKPVLARDLEDERDALQAENERMKETREVKPLVWEADGTYTFTAHTLLGTYCIDFSDGWWAFLIDEIGDPFEAHASPEWTYDESAIDELQAAAQADYEHRILSALKGRDA